MNAPIQTTPAAIAFETRVRHYNDILCGLFKASRYNRPAHFFEFACALLRVAGHEGPGWDPWVESQALLADLRSLMKLAHSTDTLADPDRTEMRLALLSYCHIMEVDLTYTLIANLLRVSLGKRYDFSPFADLYRVSNKKKPGIMQKVIPPTPGPKIKRIQELAESAKMSEIGKALGEIHDPIIRNAVYHSDYALYGEALHLFNNFRLSPKKRYYDREVEYAELVELIDNAFAFSTALFGLYDACRRGSFKDFKDAFIPLDVSYKALLEFLFDAEDVMIGFRVYWPNGTQSTYSRTKHGTVAVNIMFGPERTIEFQVNLYASKPGSFSPLVEHDAQPVYSPRPGTGICPHWPDDLRSYRIVADGSISV
jgi:hypothetical protein